jgi:hypothetical protein
MSMPRLPLGPPRIAGGTGHRMLLPRMSGSVIVKRTFPCPPFQGDVAGFQELSGRAASSWVPSPAAP